MADRRESLRQKPYESLYSMAESLLNYSVDEPIALEVLPESGNIGAKTRASQNISCSA